MRKKSDKNSKQENKKIMAKSKSILDKKVVVTAGIAVMATLLTIAIVFGVISLFENFAENAINQSKLNYSVNFLSPFQNSDENTGSSKLDVDGVTTYFQPYRNSLSKGVEERNGEIINSEPWAVWGLFADNLEMGGKYRVTVNMAIDNKPEDKFAVVAKINTHQTGLTGGHHICETVNDITKEIQADSFKAENEFSEVTFDFEYKEVNGDEIIHNHSGKWSDFDDVYDKGKVELRIGWPDETVGIKIKSIKLERINGKLKEAKVTSSEERIPLDKKYNIKYTVTPEDSSGSDIKWNSNDEKIAIVKNGTIIPQSVGKTTITYNIGGGNNGEINVEVYTPVNDLTLNETEKLLKVGEKFNLVPTVMPITADAEIKWISTDENIVTVEAGEIKAISNGIVIVKAQTEKMEAICTIYVSNSFKDVIKGVNVEDWVYDAVANVCAKGTMSGISAESFEPQGNINRKDFLFGVAKLLGYEYELEKIKGAQWPFEDSVEETYKDAIAYLYKENIFTGNVRNKKIYIDGNDGIERQEALSILGKTIDRNKGITIQLNFTDADEINEVYIENIKNIISNNIKISKLIEGNEVLKPTDKLLRQDAAELFNILEVRVTDIPKLESIKVFLGKEDSSAVLDEKLSQRIPVKVSYNVIKLLPVQWDKSDISKIGQVGIYKILGKVRFRNEIWEVTTSVIVEDFIEDRGFGEVFYAGECMSKIGAYTGVDERIRILPVGEIPGETGDGDHGVWGVETELEPGRYIVNFVIQVDKETADENAKKGAQIARINPAFDSGEIELQLRSITLDNFEESNVWYNINCEFVIPAGIRIIELRLWYNNNVTMKVREIEVFGVSKTFPKERENNT